MNRIDWFDDADQHQPLMLCATQYDDTRRHLFERAMLNRKGEMGFRRSAVSRSPSQLPKVMVRLTCCRKIIIDQMTISLEL